MKLKVWVPLLPPGINATYGIRRGGRGLYKTQKAVDWQNDAALLIGSKAGEVGWEDHGGDFQLSYTLSQARTDLDASIKLIGDTVAEKLGFNDKRIRQGAQTFADLGEKGVLIVLEQI